MGVPTLRRRAERRGLRLWPIGTVLVLSFAAAVLVAATVFYHRRGTAGQRIRRGPPRRRARPGRPRRRRPLRQTCVDVLCAYFRLPYTAEADLSPGDAEARHAYLALREVRHTVIRPVRDHLRLDPELSVGAGPFLLGAAASTERPPVGRGRGRVGAKHSPRPQLVEVGEVDSSKIVLTGISCTPTTHARRVPRVAETEGSSARTHGSTGVRQADASVGSGGITRLLGDSKGFGGDVGRTSSAMTGARRTASCAPRYRRTGPRSGWRVPSPGPALGPAPPCPTRWRRCRTAAVRRRSARPGRVAP